MNQLGDETSLPQTGEDPMEQIRELLVGEQQRRSGARIEHLEARIKYLEEDLARRFDELAARIEALGQQMAGERRASFEELSRGVVELGERVQKLSQS